MDDKRRVGRMASRDTPGLIKDDGVVWGWGMHSWRQFVEMTFDTGDLCQVSGIFGYVDYILHSQSACSLRVDVAGCIVTVDAFIAMGGQDICPVQDRVAVGARLGVNHAPIGCRVDLNLVSCSGDTMAMGTKETDVTIFALAAAGGGSADAGAVGGGMTRQATIGGMNLAGANKWRAGGGMAAHAI